MSRNAELEALLPDIQQYASYLMRKVHHSKHEDMMSCVHVAIVEAAGRWDADSGVPLKAYLVPRIKGAILDAQRENDWTSRHKRTRFNEVAKLRALGTSEADICKQLGLTAKQVRDAEDACKRSLVVSLDWATEMGSTVTSRASSPEDAGVTYGLMVEVAAAMRHLTEDERYVVTQSFLRDRQGKAIAADLGVTEGRITQIRQSAVGKLGRRLGVAA